MYGLIVFFSCVPTSLDIQPVRLPLYCCYCTFNAPNVPGLYLPKRKQDWKNMAKFKNLERCRKLLITYDFCNYRISWKLSVKLKKSPIFFLKLISTNVKTKWDIFFKFLWPSQNIWTLKNLDNIFAPFFWCLLKFVFFASLILYHI